MATRVVLQMVATFAVAEAFFYWVGGWKLAVFMAVLNAALITYLIAKARRARPPESSN